MTNGWKLEQAMSAFQSARERMRVQSDDDTLAELMASETDVRTLLVATIRAAMEADAMADAAKQRAEHLAERRKRYENRRDELRGVAFAVMDVLEERKIEECDFTVSIGKPRASLIVTDESEIPEEYWKIERKLDRAKLNDDVLKNGLVITGAMVANGIPTLTIRSR